MVTTIIQIKSSKQIGLECSYCLHGTDSNNVAEEKAWLHQQLAWLGAESQAENALLCEEFVEYSKLMLVRHTGFQLPALPWIPNWLL